MGNYRLHAREANGERNPDGSPCTGYVYRSLDLRSYADRQWLESRQYVPGRTWLYRTSQPAPLNFFEPKPVLLTPLRNGHQKNAIEQHPKHPVSLGVGRVEWFHRRGETAKKPAPEPVKN